MVTIIATTSDWVWLVLGFLIAAIISQTPKITNFKIPNMLLEYLFLFFNLFLLLWNSSWATYIVALSGGIKEMTPEQIQQLFQYATYLRVLAFIAFGFIVGLIIFAIVQVIIDKRRGRKQKHATTISTNRLESITQEIGEYKKVNDELNEFFNKMKDVAKTKREESNHD